MPWLAALAALACAACEFSSPAVAGDASGANDAASDAALDAALDAAPTPIPPSFAASAVGSGSGGAAVVYNLTVPDGSGRLLLVSVHVGSNCGSSSPETIAVTFNGTPIAPIAAITGTPCASGATRSELHALTNPPAGNHVIGVVLQGNAPSIHSAALVFSGVDQTTPIRATATASGEGDESSVAVASAVGDLVVNVVGDGNGIVGSGTGQTTRYIRNVDASNTLNNSAASTAPGASTVEMNWKFGDDDQFQTISASLRPQ